MQGNANNACYNATTAIYQVYELCVCSTVSLVCWSCRGEGPSWYVPSCTVLECSANVPRTQIILVQYIHTHTYASHYHINIRRIGNEVRRMRNVARGKQKDYFQFRASTFEENHQILTTRQRLDVASYPQRKPTARSSISSSSLALVTG